MSFRLRIKNFRALRHVDWSPEGVCVLVGPNGSGKTTLLDVPAMLGDALTRGMSWALETQGGLDACRTFSAPEREPLEFGLALGELSWHATMDARADRSAAIETIVAPLAELLVRYRLFGPYDACDVRLRGSDDSTERRLDRRGATCSAFCSTGPSGLRTTILPMDIGQPERQTHNYIRNGTLDLFAALNVATGEVIARCKQKHRAQDFVAFLREIDDSVEPELQVHVVLDNLSTHKAPPVHRWLLRHPRFHFHFTPTYSSWLNLVERFFGLLTEKALKRGSHTSIPQLREAILGYVDAHNENGKPFKWTKTADEILEKIRRFGLRTQQVHGQ